MRSIRRSVLTLALLGLAASGTVPAADLNEVAALLVFPAVFAGPAGPADYETYITITNTGGSNIIAHGSYINGDQFDPEYCYECDFNIPLTASDTEVLVVRGTPTGISIESEDGTISRNCDASMGMLVIALQDPNNTCSRTDNILLGEQIVVDYTRGFASSLSAIAFQGGTGNGDRFYNFNDVEYRAFPRRLAADFFAPNHPLSGLPSVEAEMVLFTLGFSTQNPPTVDCSVNGFDAAENNFSNSLQFGCWTSVSLCDIDPEFCFPNLGQTAGLFPDTHGWLSLDCNVDGADGGVHGSIFQLMGPGAQVRRNDPLAPALGNAWAGWERGLYQSATSGDALMLSTHAPPVPCFIP